MSIRQKLILTNIGMIVIPIICFFIVEIILGYILFITFNGDPSGKELEQFITIRFIVMLAIIALTNGALTYFVSKSIIAPIQKLTVAAKNISEGNLNDSIHSDKKDELGELTNTFEMMRLKLKEANERQLQYERNRQELIASISHDLKTPLTSIKGYVTGIQDGIANTPEKLKRYMDTIYKTANEMDNLIDELFLYSKLDLQKVPFHFEKVDLYAFFADFIDELSFQLEKEQGTARLIANEEDAYLVEADREKLKRVVANIVQNSLKYIDKEKKKIIVRLSADSESVTVELRDNGVGIKKEELSSIFDSFYRTDSSRNSATGGSGLGLSIAKKIIEEHGGSIWADSNLGEGTSIFFKLKKVIK